MKTIGVIGGMSWESTADYYRLMNEAVRSRLGGLHSAKIILSSYDFHDIEQMQSADAWGALGATLAATARSLQQAGADCVVIATNTMHAVADAVQDSVSVPLIHIADAAAAAVHAKRLTRVGLLGTRFTMELDFYKARLAKLHGIEVVVPEALDRAEVDRVIYQELCRGLVTAEARAEFARIVDRLADRGAQGVILGCTEIPMLLRQDDVVWPLFDTTRLHAEAAVDFALAQE